MIKKVKFFLVLNIFVISLLSELAKNGISATAKRENGMTNIYADFAESKKRATALYVVKKLGF